jgi:hypothetical protein
MKYNGAMHPSKSDTLDGLKVQDVEITARWHNIYLGTTIFFFFTTVLFSALFGGYYTAFVHERDKSTSLAVVESLVTKTSSDAICAGHAPTFETFSQEKHCMVATNDGVYAILDVECQYACDKYRKLELVNAGNHFTLNDFNNGTARRRMQTINGVTYTGIVMNSTGSGLSNGASCSNDQVLSTGQGCWCSGMWSSSGCMNDQSSSRVTAGSSCELQKVIQDDYSHYGWACIVVGVSIATPTDAVPTNGLWGILNMARQCHSTTSLVQTGGVAQGCWCESSIATVMQNWYSNAYLCYKGIQQSASVTCHDGNPPVAVSQRDENQRSVGWVCGAIKTCAHVNLIYLTHTSSGSYGCKPTSSDQFSIRSYSTNPYECTVTGTAPYNPSVSVVSNLANPTYVCWDNADTYEKIHINYGDYSNFGDWCYVHCAYF